ncbi:hypothetical protein F503_05238 [Ophiostoma piceae UAMH 11346]|uniref:Developmental regulator n=1 Tax=Ophiostoma piceae (strain UAMH 11346) TaxID=1262450 RepID=S3CTV9_OPHP1|nr:hypothetical protein F503_05238 [Ophiostoma piceae UAMH 11346]
MPTYLCHGFRWHRPSIRTFVILQNLDEVSPDWIARPGTTRALIDVFYNLFPFLPTRDVEADAEAEVAAVLAAQKEAAQKAIAAAAAAEERGRKQAEAAAASRSKSKSRKDKKVKEAKDTASEPPAMPSISPISPGANAFAAAVAAMRANIESTPPGKCPTPVIPANFPMLEQPGVPPDGVVRRGDGRDAVLALQDKSCIKLLEEYDSDRLDEWTRPHAYVADYVTRVDLSVSIVDEMARYERLQQQRWRREAKTKDGQPSMAGPADEGPTFATLGGSLSGGTAEGSRGNTLTKKKKTAGWLEMVRDQLQRGEEIRWYIVVNNDEKRSFENNTAAEDGDDKKEAGTQDYEAEDEDGFVEAGSDNAHAVLKRNQDAERERERRRLRFQLTGDPDILIDDLSKAETEEDDLDEQDELDNTRPGTATGNGVTPSASNNTFATSNTYSSTASERPTGNSSGRPRGMTTTSMTTTATNTTATTDSTPMVFPLPPQQEARRPHTSAAPNGQINASFLSDFPSPPQLVLSSPSRQLPPRQSQTPNFSTPHSPLPQQQIPPMPPMPTSPPVSPTPPQLRNKKSFDLRPKSSGGGGFRRLFGRSKQDS